MKLISCHIEHFGKLEDLDLSFQEGLQTFCLPNGEGKSTLAAFLRAMLFGMDGYSTAAKGLPERLHYYPYGGGRYGGTLILEARGERFRIERFFGKKSDTDDTMTVYGGDGMETDRLSPVPGEKLFNVSRETFTRTVFFDAPEDDDAPTQDLLSRLGNLVDGGDYRAALERLQAARKSLRSDRRQNNRYTGRLPDAEDDILRLQNELSNLKKREEALADSYLRMQEMQTKVDKLTAEKTKAEQIAVIRAGWDVVDGYLRRAEEAKTEADEILSRYPGGVPDGDVLTALEELRDRSTENEGKRQLAVFPAEKEAQRGTWQKFFAEGVPDEGTLAKTEETIAALARAEDTAARPAAPDERAAALAARFTDGVPTEEELRAAQAKADRIRARESAPAAAPQTPPRNAKRCLLFAILSGVLAAAGGALCAVLLPLGIALCALGAVGLLLSGFVYLGNKNRAPAGTAAPADDGDRRALGDFLWRYGYRDADVVTELFRLCRDLEEYLGDETRRAAEEATRKSAEDEARRLKGELTSFFARYPADPAPFGAMLAQIRRGAEELARLDAERERATLLQRALTGEAAEVRETAAALLAPFRLQPQFPLGDQIRALRSDRAKWDAACRAEQENRETAERERASRGLSERPTETEFDASAAGGEIAALQHELAVLKTQAEAEERALEAAEDKQNALAAVKEEREALTAEYEALTAAVRTLETAEKNLVERYVSPVREGYTAYSRALEPALAEGLQMDASLRVKFDRAGEARSDLHLSRGLRTLFAVCLRLTLIDRMFEEEAPFLLMDDPFVHLDEAHMARAGRMMAALAERHQILYFCCHESRALPAT